MKPETEVWVDLAEIDFRTAEGVMTLSSPIPESACYHAQQCVEKYLKAVIEEAGEPVPRTHDLGVLLALAAEHVSGLEVYQEEVEAMVPYAVELRYSRAASLFTDLDDEAERALATMARVRSKVRVALDAPGSDEG